MKILFLLPCQHETLLLTEMRYVPEQVWCPMCGEYVLPLDHVTTEPLRRSDTGHIY